MSSPIVTRFAPSPTGALHVGGARTALFSWAYARKHAGKFILRFEDTDRARSSEASEKSILADLEWLGLDWDEGPLRQSERLDIYNEHIEKLLTSGRAYEDDGAVRFRVDDDVTIDDAVFGKVEVKAADVEDFVIRKGEAGDFFPTFHFAVVVDDALMGVTHVIRGQEHLSNTPKHAALYDALGFDRPTWAHTPSIMNPDGSKMSKRDKAKAARNGAVQWLTGYDGNPKQLKKQIESTQKSLHRDGSPVFQTIHDLEQFLSKRSDDILEANTLARALNLQLPEIDVADFRASGYLPAVLCNYIALLGWNPGGDVEQFDMVFFVDHFGLERVGKANSKFDRDKLFRFNADAIKALPPEDFRQKLYDFSKTLQLRFAGPDDEQFVKFANAYQDRTRTLSEPEQLGAFFFKAAGDIEYDDKARKKVLEKNDGEGFAVLADIAPILQTIEPWTAEQIDKAVHDFAESRELGMGKVAQPLRVAVTGSTVSPSIGDTLELLGRDQTLERIERAGSLK